MEDRHKKVRALLKAEKLDGLLISSSYNIRYLTEFDGFSTDEREGYALITNLNLYIFADPRLSEDARKNSKNTTVVEFGADKKLLPKIQETIQKENLKIIGFEENLTYSEYKRFKKLKNIKFKMTEEIVEEVRMTKNADELSSLQKACKLTDDAFSYILKKIKSSVTEEEIAWEIEKFIRENGGELAFPTIVAFGANSAVPHHKTTNYKLHTNCIILLDFGAKVDGYCADMTRTIYFGLATEKFKKMYETVRIAQHKPFEIGHMSTPIKSGSNITCQTLDKAARDYIVRQGFPNIPHSVGHGVGLEVHELPHITSGNKQKIQTNTVFTIEPGIYLPAGRQGENEYGGVRIEDTVWYDGEEVISLTKSEKKLIEII